MKFKTYFFPSLRGVGCQMKFGWGFGKNVSSKNDNQILIACTVKKRATFTTPGKVWIRQASW